MDIKKVIVNKSSGAKLIYIPKNSGIEEGDYVKIIKVSIEEEDEIGED